MSNDMKKYIFTAVTLGLIAASGALLIEGTNMLTRDRIAENEITLINNGMKKIYGEQAQTSEAQDVANYQYVTKAYQIVDDNNAPLGYAFRTDGSNNYGKISLIIGFNQEHVYKGLSVIANEQSFANDLKKGYLDYIQDGSQTIDDVSVSCGATYGAKLVRAMVLEAEKAEKEYSAK